LLIYNLTPFTRYKKTDYCTNIHYFEKFVKRFVDFIENNFEGITPHYEKMTDIPFEIPESWEW
jgi:hypothetical protein